MVDHGLLEGLDICNVLNTDYINIELEWDRTYFVVVNIPCHDLFGALRHGIQYTLHIANIDCTAEGYVSHVTVDRCDCCSLDGRASTLITDLRSGADLGLIYILTRIVTYEVTHIWRDCVCTFLSDRKSNMDTLTEADNATAVVNEEGGDPQQLLSSSTAITRRSLRPSQNCEIEKMVTIETVSLRKGGWRNTDGFLNDLRHIDPQAGVLIFYGSLTAVMFYLYWRKLRSLSTSTLYTTSSLAMIALSLSAAFGIDFFGAVGAAFLPH